MFSARPDLITAMAPARPRILAQIVLGVNALCLASGALAQDEVRNEAKTGLNYEVRIDAPRNLREQLENNLDLMRWRGNARMDLEQLQRLVRVAPEQVKTLIATEGYYTPKVSSGLDTSGSTPVARVVVEPGQPTVVGDVDIELRGFASADKGGTTFDTAGPWAWANASAPPTGKRPSATCCAR
jgi:translocation and assembly module TamA